MLAVNFMLCQVYFSSWEKRGNYSLTRELACPRTNMDTMAKRNIPASSPVWHPTSTN
jgi:hypothetical protein